MHRSESTNVAYFDAAATTPVDPRVADLTVQLMTTEFGNAGSRTHDFGSRAKRAADHAREQIALVVDAEPEDVMFTSGATEANNLAILGMAAGLTDGPGHFVVSAIEHHAVLEPAHALRSKGHHVDVVDPNPTGVVPVEAVLAAVRPDTVLVSIMQVNNETGVRQPIIEIAEALPEHVYMHTDASQGFGKELPDLRHPRLDLVSASGHKLFAPKGVGVLIARRRRRRRPPIAPIMFGGGQERGFRPGTLSVPLAAAFGLAAELSCAEHGTRRDTCLVVREALLEELSSLSPVIHGADAACVPHILNVSIPGIDGEAAILALRELVAVSNGSACTSEKYEPSHVLAAMGVDPVEARGAIRFSWTHESVASEVRGIAAALGRLR